MGALNVAGLILVAFVAIPLVMLQMVLLGAGASGGMLGGWVVAMLTAGMLLWFYGERSLVVSNTYDDRLQFRNVAE